MLAEGWERAWHGTKIEALYCQAFLGHLLPSQDESRGERFFREAPGVYVHSDALNSKAEFYCRFVQLTDDGIFWAIKLEVLVHRGAKAKGKRGTDQWIQTPSSVVLRALWVCARNAAEVRVGDHVSLTWNPFLEGSPFDPFWDAKAELEGLSGSASGRLASVSPGIRSRASESSSPVELPGTATAEPSSLATILPKGWTHSATADGKPCFYNAQFRESLWTLDMDLGNDPACMADPLAVLRVWEGCGRLSPWCTSCRKWMQPDRLHSSQHVKALSWLPSRTVDGAPPTPTSSSGSGLDAWLEWQAPPRAAWWCVQDASQWQSSVVSAGPEPVSTPPQSPASSGTHPNPWRNLC